MTGTFRPPWQPADPAPAPALSDEEAARVAEFEAAPVLAESWENVERVAAALNAAPTEQTWLSHHDLRVLAVAAITALGGAS